MSYAPPPRVSSSMAHDRVGADDASPDASWSAASASEVRRASPSIEVEPEPVRLVRPVPRLPPPRKGILKAPAHAPPSTANRILAQAAALAFRPAEGSTLARLGGALNRWTNPAPAAVAGTPPAPSFSASAALSAIAPAAPSVVGPASEALKRIASTSTAPPLSIRPLKSVRFTIATLKIVYPINQSGVLPPSDEADTRARVEHEFWARPAQKWTGRDLERLYDECCRTREEAGLEPVRAALRECANELARALDLTDQPVSVGAAEALGDLLSVDFGLRKLVLSGSNLDDDALKPILHALLVSGNLPTISFANNKRIRLKGWRLIAVFVRKATALRFLDLSDNILDKRTVELLVQAFGSDSDSRTLEGREPDATSDATTDARRLRIMPAAPLLRDIRAAPDAPCQLSSIRLDNCGLKNQALEALAHGVRTSGIKHVSLRRNRISSLGAVALAIMLRDYDGVGPTIGALPAFDAPTPISTPALSLGSDQMLESRNSVTARQRGTLPPPQRRTTTPANDHAAPPAPDVKLADADVDEDASFGAERRPMLAARPPANGTPPMAIDSGVLRDRIQRQIDMLPRVGALVTLDVRSNDIRNGVVYIAQVLRRNRTLRILNLSDNKIDPQGLAAVAEALKLNSTLETLDMSRNPCCGPSLEGITTLRTAFAHDTKLVRVFLNATDLASEGAICLAEFLPEVKNLLHLDLTENYDIDIAGLMALAVALKMNYTIRCLDLNIPANDPDFARLSQDILQSCIRNTEIAQARSSTPVAAPIHKSAVARNLEESKQQQQQAASARDLEDLLASAQNYRDLLVQIVEAAERAVATASQLGLLRDIVEQARSARTQIIEAVRARRMPPAMRSDLLRLSDELDSLIERSKQVANVRTSPFKRPSVETALARALEAGSPSSSVRGNSPSPSRASAAGSAPNPPSSMLDIVTSPTFSIVDSDEESDGEASAPPTASAVPGLVAATDTPSEESSHDDSLPSPVDPRFEEGEVFRRKALIDAQPNIADIDDGEATAGDELRKQILEADVPENSSPRAIPVSPPASPPRSPSPLATLD